MTYEYFLPYVMPHIFLASRSSRLVSVRPPAPLLSHPPLSSVCVALVAMSARVSSAPLIPEEVALPRSEFLRIGGSAVKAQLAQIKAARLAAKAEREAKAAASPDAAAASVDELQLKFLATDDPAADAFAQAVHEHVQHPIHATAAAAASDSTLAASSSAAAAASPVAAASSAAAARPAALGFGDEDFIAFSVDDSAAALTTPAAKGRKRKAGALDDDDDDAEGSPAPSPTPMGRAAHTEGAYRAPWATCAYSHPNFTLRLHEELLDFCIYVSPKPAEQTMREELIARLELLVREAFPSSPNVHLKPFGSYATKLYLPISDIDLVLFGVDESRFVAGEKGKNSPLGVLERVMRSKQSATYLEHISGARIPILKLTDKLTGVKVDICYAIEGGLRAAEFIVSMQQHMPALRPLTLFLKYFLHCRVLNDTYKGGIGSFMLQLMLINHLQALQLAGRLQHPTTNLGMLLMSFLESYGISLNYKNAGLNMNAAATTAAAGGAARPAGSAGVRTSFFNKSARGWFNANRPYLLSIENPLDSNHDVGANSYLIMRVRKALQFAYQTLAAHVWYEAQRLERGEPLIRKSQRHDLSRAADPAHPFAAASHTPQTLLSHIVSVNDEIREGQEEVEPEEMERQQQQREQQQQAQRDKHVHKIESSSSDEEDAAAPIPLAPEFMHIASSSSSDDDDAALDSSPDDDAEGPSSESISGFERFADPDGGASDAAEEKEEDASSDDDASDAASDSADDDDSDGGQLDSDADFARMADLDDELDGNNQRNLPSSSKRKKGRQSGGSKGVGASPPGEDYISLSDFPAPPGGSGRGAAASHKKSKKGKGYQFDNAAPASHKKRSKKSKGKTAQLQGARMGGTKPSTQIFASKRSEERKKSKKKRDKQQSKKQRT